MTKTFIQAIFTAIEVNSAMDAKQVGKMIRFHRKQSGLSQEELAQFAGLGKTVIFDAEKGKLTIRFDTLIKILNVLNIKITFQSQLMDLFKGEK